MRTSKKGDDVEEMVFFKARGVCNGSPVSTAGLYRTQIQLEAPSLEKMARLERDHFALLHHPFASLQVFSSIPEVF